MAFSAHAAPAAAQPTDVAMAMAAGAEGAEELDVDVAEDRAMASAGPESEARGPQEWQQRAQENLRERQSGSALSH